MVETKQYKLVCLDSGIERPYEIAPEGADIISRWLSLLNETEVDYAVGGAFAMHAHTGIWRDTKDFDVFVAPQDLKKVLNRLSQAYFNPDIRDTSWLAKVESTPYNFDIIFGFRNGLMKIDRQFLEHSVRVEVMGVQTRALEIEELIASKAYIARRYRFDGADIAHLIRESKGKLDWERLLRLMDGNRDVLFWHLIFFLIVYPGHSDFIPRDLLADLFNQLVERGQKITNPKLFQGTLLDPVSFGIDYLNFGYEGYYRAKPLVNHQGEVL
ncbi:MAG: nucleotidyl transferase [Candidatus Abyssobacteria bacterium SURF_5]|uniref:Nucleotidyl transferase n=1 Tax=Abyssobacteria bacterium (strain SURF_5) TaxID=2093360 RepID=A0A3A4NRW7_ABYX5|nr:MAG: nucleotidyl transferase [Candidatus Abyssubacteria bacterium SURF_5]